MKAPSSIADLARQWPVVGLLFASALGAMYCAPQWALARWALAHPAAVTTPTALAQWRQAALLYGAGLATGLAFFLGSCLWLRRHRTRGRVDVGAPAA